MTIMHLPNGPTANFKLSSVRLTKDIAVSIIIVVIIFYSYFTI